MSKICDLFCYPFSNSVVKLNSSNQWSIILSDILSDIFSDIQSDIRSRDIHSGIHSLSALCEHRFNINSGASCVRYSCSPVAVFSSPRNKYV